MNMKSIIKCGLLLLGLGTATVSCEDMFTADNTLVTQNLAPQDTLYQVMGIVKRMQKLADRTVLLGEVRADLVTVDPAHAPADIQELDDNNVSATNIYNQPVDYYAVINSCNIYLANVDSLRNSQGTRRYYEKEILSVKCYRAWCYLELLKTYGEVPYLRDPVLTSDAAEGIVASGQKANLETILSDMIDDLKDFRGDENNELRQSYANSSFNSVRLRDVAIPVRAMLAELYLWRGSYKGTEAGHDDFINAIRMYHDYFTFKNEEINTGTSKPSWPSWNATRENEIRISDYNYENYFSKPENYAGVLPLETSGYYGTVSQLRRIFCSQDSNNYYPAVVASQRAKDISNKQDYCELILEAGTTPKIQYRSHDANMYSNYSTAEGDLRLYAVADGDNNVKSNFDNSRENSSYNNMYYLNQKYGNNTDGKNYLPFVPFFRNNILYLHFAEALNRAGFPETAFAILKYGLSYFTIDDYISADEFDRLCEIKSYGFSVQDPRYSSEEMTGKTAGSAAIWSSDVFTTPYVYSKNQVSTSTERAWWATGSNNPKRQIGIHSIGCGDTEYDDNYYLDDEETQAELDRIDEELPVFEYPEPGRPIARELLQEVTSEEEIIEDEPFVRMTFMAEEEGEDNLVVEYTYAEYLEWYQAYSDAYDTYEENLEAWKTRRAEYISSDEVVNKRTAHVAELILEEEALEGIFEGQRFYDIMRYQMQELGGANLGKTITMPACIEEKYGTTTKMVGKPWFLTLPSR